MAPNKVLFNKYIFYHKPPKNYFIRIANLYICIILVNIRNGDVIILIVDLSTLIHLITQKSLND